MKEPNIKKKRICPVLQYYYYNTTFNCLYCNTRVKSKYHFFSIKHEKNLIIYNNIIKEVLCKSGQLNDNNITDIMEFIGEGGVI